MKSEIPNESETQDKSIGKQRVSFKCWQITLSLVYIPHPHPQCKWSLHWVPAEEDEKRHTRQCMLSEMPRLHRTNNNNNNKDTRNSSSVSQSVSQSVSPNSPPAEKKNRHQQQQQQPKEHVCAMCLRFIFDCHIEHHIIYKERHESVCSRLLLQGRVGTCFSSHRVWIQYNNCHQR